MLKVVPLEDDESDQEADALELWSGDGAVRLLRHDRARRAMLIERARPGNDASVLVDDEATAVARDVGRRLWRAPGSGHPFRWIGDHVPGWLDAAGHHELVPLARQIYASMTVGRQVVVHGDFHHHNLLQHGERWIAIDPKAMLGEPEFDVPPLLWNPIGITPTRERSERIIAAFAAAGLDAERIRQWAIVRGAYLGLPPDPGETEDDVRQLRVARQFLA